MSETLSPIPTPPSQWWRQIRLQYVPVAMFLAALVVAALLWARWVTPAAIVGEAEAVRAEVRSAAAATVVSLAVQPMQAVKAGQPVAEVMLSDPKVLEASLAVLRAEIELMRVTKEPVVGQQRVALDFERLQLDWLSKRVDLTALQGELVQAEATLARAEALKQTNMIAADAYDLAKNTRDRIAAQLKAQTELVNQMEPGIRNIREADVVTARPAAPGMQAAIKHKEEELRLIQAQMGSRSLLAPIDGVVTLIYRRAGETVAAAEPILQISATTSERIVGFLRQPVSREPKPGATVEIRTRAQRRKVGTAVIEQVGVQLEPITPTLLAAMRLPVSTVPTDLGLRVQVSAPAGMGLRPGEHVDLILRD